MWKFSLETNTYIETLPNGVEHVVVYKQKGSLQNTKIFKVPANHFFYLVIIEIAQKIVDILKALDMLIT